MQGGANVNFVSVSDTCLFAPAQYYKLNKGFFLGFLFKPLGGLCPPCGLNKKVSEKYPLFITYIIDLFAILIIAVHEPYCQTDQKLFF